VQIAGLVDIASAGRFPRSKFWQRAVDDVEAAIEAAVWPEGTARFSLNPEPTQTQSGKTDRHPNGVTPIKLPMIAELERREWVTETLPELPVGKAGADALTTGDLDALLQEGTEYVGFEWETGNVSSSHRAINKLLDGITRGSLQGGVLVLAVRETARYLTDRVGNFEELAPYFEFWQRYPVPNGVLRIYGVRHDALDSSVPHIPKTTAGRALG
jgi:Restriction endonuclease BamHI